MWKIVVTVLVILAATIIAASVEAGHSKAGECVKLVDIIDDGKSQKHGNLGYVSLTEQQEDNFRMFMTFLGGSTKSDTFVAVTASKQDYVTIYGFEKGCLEGWINMTFKHFEEYLGPPIPKKPAAGDDT